MSGTKVHSNYEDLLTFTRASKGHALRPVSYGDELVTNGDFSSTDLSDWSSAINSTATVTSGELVVTGVSASGRQVASISTTVGQVYRLTGEARVSTGSGTALLAISDTTGGLAERGFVTTTETTATNLQLVFVATQSTHYVTAGNGSSGTGNKIFDNVSVKEVTFDQPDGTLTLFEHPNNVPRVEWDADRNRLGLLVEESRTNLVTRSESFDNSAWTAVEGSITANTITAPDGTSTADFFVPNTNNVGNHLVRDSVNVSSAQHSWSVFAKAGGYNWIRLVHGDGDDTDHSAYFDISNGVVGAVSGSATASITDVGNSWYRCSVTASAAASASSTQNQFIVVAEGDDDVTFAGNGTSGVYLWGAQLEVGAFPTSYIKSDSGSTTTRSADVASIPVADFGYNTGAGTFVATASLSYNPSEDERYVIGTDSSLRRWIYKNDSLDELRIFDGSSSQTSTVELEAGQLFKVGVFSDSSTKGIVTNGETPVTNATNSNLTSLTSSLKIGNSSSSNNQLNGHIKSIQYYPRRLTDAQLQALTEPRSTPTLSLTFDGLESSYTENYIHG